METKIDFISGNLEAVVYTLLAEKARGNHVYYVFNGHELHSDTVTMDSAYQEVIGCTKEEFDRRVQEERAKFDREEESRKLREQGYLAKVEAARTGEKQPITQEKVVAGLKFIAEHRDMEQEELIDGLLALGCDFSLEDIREQFPEAGNLFDGMKAGKTNCGASVIANVRDSEYGRAFAEDRFLSLDDDTSVYHFIRVATGDEGYTKAAVESMSTEGKHIR